MKSARWDYFMVVSSLGWAFAQGRVIVFQRIHFSYSTYVEREGFVNTQ